MIKSIFLTMLFIYLLSMDCRTPGGSYYSSSLSTYLSPPPENRWRRTASDSALYQSVKVSQHPATDDFVRLSVSKYVRVYESVRYDSIV